jgi:hypothetical protein
MIEGEMIEMVDYDRENSTIGCEGQVYEKKVVV